MKNLNLEAYFNEKENKYYKPIYLLNILEDICGKTFDDIKKEIDENKIVVTREQIEKYLEQKLIEEDPELKERIENPKPKRTSNITKWTKQDIEDSSQEFVDGLSIQRYRFEPFTLEYYNKYTTIIRNKVNLLLNIIEKVSSKDIETIQDMLTSLDIVLDENGSILKSDIIRLIPPTIYNINELNATILKANDLDTYLTFKMSKHFLYREGFSENEIYPAQSIQIKNLYYDYLPGNVRLSENQKKILEEKEKRNRDIVTKALFL